MVYRRLSSADEKIYYGGFEENADVTQEVKDEDVAFAFKEQQVID